MGEIEEEKREYNLGILIILIILCWPAAIIYYFTRPKVKPKAVRICPGCGRQISLEYNVCPYCARSIPAVAPTPVTVTAVPAPTPPPAPSGKFCTSCGAPIDPTAKFCTKCGKEVS